MNFFYSNPNMRIISKDIVYVCVWHPELSWKFKSICIYSIAQITSIK